MSEPMTPYNIQDFSDAEVQEQVDRIVAVCDSVANLGGVSAERARITLDLYNRLLNGNFNKVKVKGSSIKIVTFDGDIQATCTANLTAAPWKIIVTPILKPGAKSYRPH